ncbi:MAG: RnfABCDGE type electron transport complex subunit A [Candidatus Aegiribacteria sp.]|nr:RnfABCDGE type electron transport complex subunit A [Candidatus Aegiribacteria sp.]MBD3294458.1 RnfABCDGE type electron transport complex subunit A [Candidatus Fermentibacteria bacterium]
MNPSTVLSTLLAAPDTGSQGFDIGKMMAIIIAAIFVNNFVLSRFLGICPFLGVSKQLDSAVGMGAAVIFVMTLATLGSWTVYHLLLVPMELTYLRTIAFILIIASLVQLVEMILQKFSPSLYQALGIFLPLITTNCAILGVAVLNINEGYSLGYSLVNAVAAGIGFTLALVLMAGLRQKLELADVPPALKGKPVAFLVAGVMSIAFLGFAGLGG